MQSEHIVMGVIAFLDSILLNAIKSSPHTTPQKIVNSTIKCFDAHLKPTYNIRGEESAAGGGEGEEEEEEDDDDDDDDATFDVIDRDEKIRREGVTDITDGCRRACGLFGPSVLNELVEDQCLEAAGW
ncbi:hypothetical protein I7I51_07089 [Histoplasma capsulatum]|uniref:Uncharacterized protein n=1 Tax=Ajellomyces capsulatus TaxID=5037 RepID=A0A8A1MNM0_AJECA|nr:hypothetical protein I7I51_07089 [Histoplasma capsulatum]